MSVSGTVQLLGRLRYMPSVPNVDSSANPTWLSDVVEMLACSARKEEEYTLTADGDTAVSFGSLSAVNLVVVKVAPNTGIPPTPGFPNGVPAVPNPVTIRLTSSAGIAPFVVDPFLFLISAGVPYTAMTIARTAGVQTVVRVQLFTTGS